MSYADQWRFFVELPPVPASRPRVSRWGSYYQPRYRDWKKEAAKVLPPLVREAGIPAVLLGPLVVEAWFYATRPKTTKLEFPGPDIDNYEKALYDALNGVAWKDDSQLVAVEAHKRWAPAGKPGWIDVTITRFKL